MLIKFKSTATEYGCEHEKTAREQYKSELQGKHSSFKVSPCVFFVDKATQYIGASPDGLVECNCCHQGVVEIKCPHCAKDAEYMR